MSSDPEYYVVASHEENGLVFQMVVPILWAEPVREGVVPSTMIHPQILITRSNPGPRAA